MIRTRKSRRLAPAGGFSWVARRRTRWVRSSASWTLTSAWSSARWMSRTTSLRRASSTVDPRAIFWSTPRKDFPRESNTMRSVRLPWHYALARRRISLCAPGPGTGVKGRGELVGGSDERYRSGPTSQDPTDPAAAQPRAGAGTGGAGARTDRRLQGGPARLLQGGGGPRGPTVYPVPTTLVRRGVSDLPGLPRVHPAHRRPRFRRRRPGDHPGEPARRLPESRLLPLLRRGLRGEEEGRSHRHPTAQAGSPGFWEGRRLCSLTAQAPTGRGGRRRPRRNHDGVGARRPGVFGHGD